MAENEILRRAFAWLTWEVEQQRASSDPTGKTGLQRVAAVVRETLPETASRRGVFILEDRFDDYLESIGADGPSILSACRDRGWIEPTGGDADGRGLWINETRLADDAGDLAGDNADGGTDASKANENNEARKPAKRQAANDPKPHQVEQVREVLREGSKNMKRESILDEIRKRHGQAFRPATLKKILDRLREDGDYTG